MTKIPGTFIPTPPRYVRTLTTIICSNNFSFKCHRRDQSPTQKDQSLVYAVNDISFHPVHGTFSTCGWSALPPNDRLGKLMLVALGADGTINYWDKDARTRLKCKFLYSVILNALISSPFLQPLILLLGRLLRRALTALGRSLPTLSRMIGRKGTLG